MPRTGRDTGRKEKVKHAKSGLVAVVPPRFPIIVRDEASRAAASVREVAKGSHAHNKVSTSYADS